MISPLPSISVVVPSYNQGRWIGNCLESIVQQMEENDQLIVVDGGSTDNTGEILRQYADHIDHLVIERDEGQADALRKGFAFATGDISAYLNTDDMLLPGALAFVRNYFRDHSAIDAIYSHRVFIDGNNAPIRFWLLPSHSSYCMKRWDYIPQETCFWRRTLMEEAGGIDAGYQFAVDYDLFVRMMAVGRFKRLNRLLACFRDHADSKTNTQYETLGVEEVHRIRDKYNIKLRWYDSIIGNVFGQLIIKGSWLFKLLIFPFVRHNIVRQIARYTSG